MEKTKHTPGPWTLGPCAGQVEGPKGELLAGGIDYRIPDDVKLSNSRLIAAAPDLLEALNKVASCSRYPKNDTENPAFALDALRSIARDAIAKAGGRE